MADIEIRPARAGDKDAVLAFCTNTWSWGDYIEFVWEQWLTDESGKLFVAVADDRPVGLAHVQMVTPTDAWLEGMRVAPEYRQRGIASALNEAMFIEAMKRGATYARLVTESANEATKRLCERDFMRRVGAFAAFHDLPADGGPLKSEQETPVVATEADIDDIINYINTSNVFPLTGGLYYYAFTAYPITGESLAKKVAEGHVYILRRWDRLDGFAIAEPHHGRQGARLSIGYIDGTTETVSLIAYDLRRRLVEMQLESIYAYVPDVMMLRDAFIGAGYEWENKVFYTYERSLT